jgi:hypothetical protein
VAVCEDILKNPLEEGRDEGVCGGKVKNGKFSVKSIYDLLTSTDCGDSFTRIWKAKVPYKNKIFLWLRTMPSLQKIT